MEFRVGISGTLILLFLLNLLCVVSSNSCKDLKCEPGFIQKKCRCEPCASNNYWLLKRGKGHCERCTQPCSAKEHLKQVTDCTKTSNRVCRCDSGFFCDSPSQYSCRRCKPCALGTFSNVHTQAKSCQQHTNCTLLNMTEISKGNSTHDSVCIRNTMLPPPSSQIPTIMEQNYPTMETSTPPSTPTKADTQDPKPERDVTEGNPQKNVRYHTRRVLTGSGPTTPELSSNRHLPDTQEEKSPYVLIILFVLLAVTVLLCLARWHKTWVFKSLLKWKGRLFLRNEDKEAQEGDWQKCRRHLVSETRHAGELLCPLDSDRKEGPCLDGVELSPGSMQQGTVDYTGGRENVNNTVGSIFIYSPGTVILGANTPERRREMEDRVEVGEEPGEGRVLISTPQQESYEQEGGAGRWERVPVVGDPMRECVQEEERKELCYPIPATGK